MAQESTDVSQFVTLSPDSHIQFAHGAAKTEFVISNRSPTKNICFKIRTTMPMLFVVKPISGIVEANKEATIEINYVQIDQAKTGNASDAKFQVQVAYTDLMSHEMARLANFYQYLTKSQIHSFKLPVKMAMSAAETPIQSASPDISAQKGASKMVDRDSEVYASAVQPQASPEKPKPAPVAPQSFERAPTTEVNRGVESSIEASQIYKSTVGGNADLSAQINAYRKMIEKEQSEIDSLKQQVQKKGQTVGKSSPVTQTAGGAAATAGGSQVNWEENTAASKGKFKFIHLIIVSIVFLLLGSYLAKVPIASTATTKSAEEGGADDQL